MLCGRAMLKALPALLLAMLASPALAETLIHKKAVLDRWCAEIGRDPSEIERSTSTRRPPSEVADGLAKAGIGMVVIPMEAGDTDGALALARQWLQWRDTA